MIYLDYNASAPILPDVAAAMRPWIEEQYGNPSSIHQLGLQARHAVDEARLRVANLLICHPDEVVFTSGGTEAANLAIKGIALAHRAKGNRIVTSKVEHPCVLESCRHLEREGFDVVYLDVDETGRVCPSRLAAALNPRTILVSIQHANNELGTFQPIEAIARETRRRGIPLHVDAAQTVGKIRVDCSELDADLLSISGHKFHAPKGVGALVIRRGIRIEPLLHGAEQEAGRRGGTENVAGIVGLGAAASLAARRLPGIRDHLCLLRNRIEERIVAGCSEVRINGHSRERLPNTSHLSFRKPPAERLLQALAPFVAVSAGSACLTCGQERRASHVLEAIRLPKEWVDGSIRLSVGEPTTIDEVDRAAEIICHAVATMNKEMMLAGR